MSKALSDRRTRHSLQPPVKEIIAERVGNLPIWIRPPKTGQEFYTGLSRAKLYELAGNRRIKTRSLREPGQVKGTRVFELQSVLDYIEHCEPETAAA